MKELITTLCALLFSTSLNAADIVPLEIEFGMWKNELAEKITASLNLKEGPMAKAMAQMEEAAKKNPQMAKQYEKYMKMMKAQQKNLSAASSASCLNEVDYGFLGKVKIFYSSFSNWLPLGWCLGESLLCF